MGNGNDALDLTRPGIIEASAGTGKTFTIARIYLALLRGEKILRLRREETPETNAGTPADDAPAENFPAPHVREILVVTFTEAATAELRSRLQKNIRDALAAGTTDARTRDALRLADAEFDEAAISTIHGFCLRILKEFNLAARTEKDAIRPSLNDEFLRFATRWRARKISAGNEKFYDISANEIVDVLKTVAKNPEAVPATDSADNALFLAATEAFPEWKKHRAASTDISYDEMLSVLQSALRRDKTLAQKIAARFKVAIVDEFQDTDPIQWEIFRLIFLACGNPIFCVGDPKQAIYEFRGGDVRTYRKARDEISATGGGNACKLGENWRSAPETIAAFNEIFSADKKIRTVFSAGTKNKPREIHAAINDFLDYSPVKFPREKATDGKNSPDVPAAVLRIVPAESNKSRAKEFIAETLANDVAGLVKGRNVPAKDIAILVSSNEEASTYRKKLGGLGIATSTTARGNVLREPIAAPLADILRAMLAPQNSAAFRRTLLSPFFAETGKKLLLADEGAEELEIARERFAEAHEQWKTRGFLAAFGELAENLGFAENIAAHASAKRIATNLAHLLEIIHDTERSGKLSPDALTDAYAALLQSEATDEDEKFQLRSDSDHAAVRILTVHKSKGLEFEIVFIPSLWEKMLTVEPKNSFVKIDRGNGETELFFSEDAKNSDELFGAVAENSACNSACVFYVALTRARRRIVLYHAPQKLPASRGKWFSYQSALLEAAGAFPPSPNAELPHWKILESAQTPLPENIFPIQKFSAAEKPDAAQAISPEEAEKRFAKADAALGKIRQNREGVFSFSSIIKTSESDAAETRENDENAGVPELPATNFSANADGEKTFPRRAFSDLPAGAEFGTITHAVFEKTDFRSRKNLKTLAENALENLPDAQNISDDERRARTKNFIALVEENLTLPLFENAFRLADIAPENTVREMEFHFPLRRAKNLFAELSGVFKSWGGIYAETAARHWSATETTLSVAGMMTGFIDLAFRANGKFYILDWKTNRVAEQKILPENLPESAFREEIVKHGYALQWAIYAVALRKFLQKSLGENYVHDRDFGGIVYLFVRWRFPFCDARTLNAENLDAFERVLLDA